VHVYKTESGFIEIEAESISQAVELGLSKGDDDGRRLDDPKIGVDNVSEIVFKASAYPLTRNPAPACDWHGVFLLFRGKVVARFRPSRCESFC